MKESFDSIGVGLYVVLLAGVSIVISIPVGLIVILVFSLSDLIRRIRWAK